MKIVISNVHCHSEKMFNLLPDEKFIFIEQQPGCTHRYSFCEKLELHIHEELDILNGICFIYKEPKYTHGKDYITIYKKEIMLDTIREFYKEFFDFILWHPEIFERDSKYVSQGDEIIIKVL